MVKIPVRNKSKDNHYTLGYDEEKNVYTVEFSDNKNIIHKIEITDKIYGAFDRFELEGVSQIHKYSKYIEHSEVHEETLNKRAVDKQLSVEKIDKQRLKGFVTIVDDEDMKKIDKAIKISLAIK